ncbi:hypothetical protein [uncultured Duncaniella sp.]|uniref:hypothetical protein n=1 Tax=uncultured Duncaniella sp. TaxID=2768039 RepID=UPI0025A9AA1C|nr:hypothetical protein [uncultured Duncaniella sp.]
MALNDFLEAIAPNYAKGLQRGRVEILEHSADAQVKRVEWTHSDFHHMDHSMSRDLKPFFETYAGSPNVFYKDCDGIILFEHDGKKYMFLTELKSQFDNTQLVKAKTQIIASFIKTNMVLNLASCYHIEDYIVKGFIVSRPPTSEFIRVLHQGSMLPSGNHLEFATRLFTSDKQKISDQVHKLLMKPTECFCIHGMPLGDRGIFNEIEMYHIAVPPPDDFITLDVRDYI